MVIGLIAEVPQIPAKSEALGTLRAAKAKGGARPNVTSGYRQLDFSSMTFPPLLRFSF